MSSELRGQRGRSAEPASPGWKVLRVISESASALRETLTGDVWRSRQPSLQSILLVSQRPEDGGPTIHEPAATFAAPFISELRSVYARAAGSGVGSSERHAISVLAAPSANATIVTAADATINIL